MIQASKGFYHIEWVSERWQEQNLGDKVDAITLLLLKISFRRTFSPLTGKHRKMFGHPPSCTLKDWACRRSYPKTPNVRPPSR